MTHVVTDSDKDGRGQASDVHHETGGDAAGPTRPRVALTATEIAIAAVNRQSQEWEAEQARAAERESLTTSATRRAAARRAERRRAPASGPTVRFTVRLEPDDLAALDERADLLGVSSGAVARNLIRIGLTRRAGHGVEGMVGELEVLAARMRGAVS